ncbi:hypothetical protein AB0F43_23815 [Kribbella sp. NPDC023972]|uniref:hypothetical protein n=1 Tax=Kribbella sp. NPDC023972 TaxID=3154795 RepID=UPI0033FE8A90
MTESNWQGDMLRRMAEQSPAKDPDRPDTPPAPAPAGAGDPATPPAPQQQGPPQQGVPPQQGAPGQQGAPPQQGPYQQQYGQQPPPPPAQYQQQPYQQPQYSQEQYPQQYPPQQPYPPEQYAPQPLYPPQEQQPYPQQEPYPPQQGYQQPPPYQPGPYDQQQYAPPPPPYEQQYPPQQGYPPPPPPPYQPAPYEQYPPQPARQQPPPYEQPPPYYPEPQFEEQYLPPNQQHPGQMPHEDLYEQPPRQEAPPAVAAGGWGQPAPAQDGDSVFRRFRRIASEAAYLVGASGRMQRDVDNIATIRRPIAIMRRVGVLSPVDNGGTSTVTALLSTMLAAQRSDRVVAVDCDPGGAELSRRLELSVGAGPIERVSLLRSEGNAEAVRTTLAEAQGQGARDVGLAVVDCPGGLFDEIPAEMAGTGHCAVVVVPSVQHVANYCLSQLDQLTPDGQDVLLTRGILVITMVENVDPASVNWLVEAFRQRGMEPVVLPFDLHIAQSWPLHSEQLQSDTRRTVLELAARVVEKVTRTAT